MKFDCDSRRERQEQRHKETFRYITSWHRWFAWYPVRLGYKDCRWLETIERKYTFHTFHENCYYGEDYYRKDYWTVEYRPVVRTMEKDGYV